MRDNLLKLKKLHSRLEQCLDKNSTDSYVIVKKEEADALFLILDAMMISEKIIDDKLVRIVRDKP